jgi:hypothetical protein
MLDNDALKLKKCRCYKMDTVLATDGGSDQTVLRGNSVLSLLVQEQGRRTIKKG